jgi:hypothetical protein
VDRPQASFVCGCSFGKRNVLPWPIVSREGKHWFGMSYSNHET